jgi:GDP-L-fucose synthase
MRILITGANGFIGKNLLEVLKTKKEYEIIAISSKDYNLLEQNQVRKLFKDYSPDAIFHLAAKVGGILANKTYPADFIYTNLALNTYFLEEARKANIKRLVYSFCGCSYPKNASNPIKEEYLFTGLPDENAMFYSIAKATNYLQLLAYRKQYALDWVAAIPGNTYGPYDNFSDKASHVIPALIRRFHFAKERGDKEVVVWGSGKPVRDFIYVEDVADGLVRMMEVYHGDSPVNISSGIGVSIKETVEIVKEVVGFEGKITWDKTKPDGHPVKIFDVSRMKKELNFEPKTKLKEGIKKTYKWFVDNMDKVRL